MNAPVKIATGLYEAIALAQSELTALSRIRSGKRWAHVGTQHGVEFSHD